MECWWKDSLLQEVGHHLLCKPTIYFWLNFVHSRVHGFVLLVKWSFLKCFSMELSICATEHNISCSVKLALFQWSVLYNAIGCFLAYPLYVVSFPVTLLLLRGTNCRRLSPWKNMYVWVERRRTWIMWRDGTEYTHTLGRNSGSSLMWSSVLFCWSVGNVSFFFDEWWGWRGGFDVPNEWVGISSTFRFLFSCCLLVRTKFIILFVRWRTGAVRFLLKQIELSEKA